MFKADICRIFFSNGLFHSRKYLENLTRFIDLIKSLQYCWKVIKSSYSLRFNLSSLDVKILELLKPRKRFTLLRSYDYYCSSLISVMQLGKFFYQTKRLTQIALTCKHLDTEKFIILPILLFLLHWRQWSLWNDNRIEWSFLLSIC